MKLQITDCRLWIDFLCVNMLWGRIGYV